MRRKSFTCLLALLGVILCSLPVLGAKLANAELELWARADTLTLRDGAPVTVWPDSGGMHNDLKSAGAAAPIFLAKGASGRPALQFSGDVKATPKVIQTLQAPFSGEWRGMTIFLVGTALEQTNWLGSDSGQQDDLRAIGGVQQCGSKCSVTGFGALAGKPGPHLAEIASGIANSGALTLTTYADGVQLATSSDPAPVYGVGSSKFIFGAYQDWTAYRGELYEIIVYKGLLSDAERRQTEQHLLVKYGVGPVNTNDASVIAGYPPPPPPVIKPGHTALTPCQNGLRLWGCADDITAQDHAPVDVWPNAAGDKQPIKGVAGHQPMLVQRALAGHAVVRFLGENSNDPKRVTQFIDTSLDGFWPECTMIFVGRHLTNVGLFDTAPNTQDTLRYSGGIQHCHTSKLNVGNAFPLLGGSEGQLGEVVLGKLGDKGQFIATYAHGFPQQRVESPDEVTPVLFKNTTFGIINRREVAFNGDLAEVLVYNRALSDQERYQTERYLSEKYDLPLKTREQIAREPKPRSAWSLRLPQLPRTMSWLGNSEGGKTNWIQHGVFTICVLPDGTVGAVSVWDEAHKELGLYKDGKALGGISGGAAMVMNDGHYFYLGISGMGKTRSGVRRVSMDLQDAPWPQGENGLIWFDVPKVWNEVQGLARVQGELFVTCTGLNEVRVYDASTGAFKRSFPCNAPGRMAAAPDGSLWIALKDGVPQFRTAGPDTNKDGVAQYRTDGTATGKVIAGVTAGGLAFDGQGRLLVAAQSARRQIITYDVSGAMPVERTALGLLGGVFAAPHPGEMREDRFISPSGVGVDAAGNIYVNDSWRILSYTPQGTLRWKLESTIFCLCGDFDPASDGNSLYTGSFHYLANAEKSAGKDWTWSGFTADTDRYPEAAEGGAFVIMRRLNGALYRFTLGGQVTVARQQPGSERFIPCAAVVTNEGSSGYARLKLAPEKGRYLWTDLNGDGLVQQNEISLPPANARHSEWSASLYVDSKGDLWEPQGRAGIRHLPLKGFAQAGAPIYDFAAEEFIPRPAEFIEVRRALYYPESDSMYLAGYTWEQQQAPNEAWIGAGREMIRYDNWSTPRRHLVSRIPFIANNISSFDLIPQRHLAFIGEMDTAVIFVYDTNTAQLLGMLEPDPDIVGADIGWLDMPGGAVRAFQRQNGEIIVTSEESYKEKMLIYRLPAGFEKTVSSKQ